MMIISIKTFEDARKKLGDPATRQEGIDMLRKILEIKEAHLWRSEAISPCCGNLGGFACQLNEETGLLNKALPLIEAGEIQTAAPLLDRLAVLIGYGMGQKETPDLVDRLTARPKQTPV